MLKIVTSPDPVLAGTCEPCNPKDKELKRLAKQMAHAMYKSHGCGLAAPQVGINKRLIVVDCEDEAYGEEPLVLINPVIMELKGEPEIAEEGCLSVPGITVPVSRQPWARVRYQDFDGDLWEIEGDGLLGRCLQHEIDHLDGVTLLESAVPEFRLTAIREYEEARRLGAQPGDTDVVTHEMMEEILQAEEPEVAEEAAEEAAE